MKIDRRSTAYFVKCLLICDLGTKQSFLDDRNAKEHIQSEEESKKSR